MRAAVSQGSNAQCTSLFHIEGEWFPVKRKLLRPCIGLTKVVRSEEDVEIDVTVDVDTDIFDR